MSKISNVGQKLEVEVTLFIEKLQKEIIEIHNSLSPLTDLKCK